MKNKVFEQMCEHLDRKSLTLEQAIKYLRDFQKNLCPGKQLYIGVIGSTIGIFSRPSCKMSSMKAAL